MQGALDRIYDACYGVPSKQSKERFALIKNMKIDEVGMVSARDAKTVFAKIHILNDNQLLINMNNAY